jgi:hypothetical protein
MRFEKILGALFVVAGISTPAQAGIAPVFNAVEQQLIQRNELLRDLAKSDPRLVRRILDIIEKAGAEPRRDGLSPAPAGVDPARNPDIEHVGRTAEGSLEWFELLKRARAEKDEREKDHAEPATRSAEGSIELIEMMKKAKAAKEAGKR